LRTIFVVVMLCFVSDSVTSAASSTFPILFMDMKDVRTPYGRIKPQAVSAQHQTELRAPPLNYTNGDTIFAAFDLGGTYEVFAAVGRPGEPIAEVTAGDLQPDGVSVLRFTTTDLVHYSSPTTVLFLENGSGSKPDANDGTIWTVKSMDRTARAGSAGGSYLLMASYGSSAHSFMASDASQPNSFTPTSKSPRSANFKDHDDCNVIYHHDTQRWVDMQIMYQTWEKKYCDNVKGARRVVTARDSKDGLSWSNDWGCLDEPQKDEHCKTFNTTAMVHPNAEDPPELEFYRIRPFTMPGSQRLLAHVLLYVPAPSDVVTLLDYGRQPLWYCKDGCCHGPHMYEEWWLGPASGDPSELAGWRRPFFDTRAFPHDIWAMAQPLVLNDTLVWVGSGMVWGVPHNRLAGLHSASNGEFSTPAFTHPGTPMWVEADAYWGQKTVFGEQDWCPGGCNGVGGSDEARSAYLQAEMWDEATQKVLPGFEKANCVFTNKGGRLDLTWSSNNTLSEEMLKEVAGKAVSVRFYFRDATLYAIGTTK
jgi:hypothetical protein